MGFLLGQWWVADVGYRIMLNDRHGRAPFPVLENTEDTMPNIFKCMLKVDQQCFLVGVLIFQEHLFLA